MRTIFNSVVIIILTGITVSSCSGKKDIASHIPSEALVVSYFDTKSLLSKLPYDSIMTTQMFQDALADSAMTDMDRRILKDPSKLGIDLSKDIAFFTDRSKDGDYNLVMTGYISNDADFGALNKALDPGSEVSSEKGVKIMVLKNKAVVGWNNDIFAFVLNVHRPGNHFNDGGSDGIQPPDSNNNGTASAKEYITSLFNLPSSGAISKESSFENLIKDSGDIKVWVNIEKMIQSASMGPLGLLKLDALVKDSRATATANFENGKISFVQKLYFNTGMTSLLKKYAGDNIRPADFAAIPSSDILAAFRFNFKPEGISALLQLAGLDGFVNMFANELNVSPEELFSALRGDVMGSISDLKIKPSSKKPIPLADADIPGLDEGLPGGLPGSPLITGGNNFNGMLAIGIRNKMTIQKLIDSLRNTVMDADIPADKLPFTLTDSEFVFSNNKDFAKRFAAHQGGTKPAWADKISGHPFGFFTDIQKMLQSLPLPNDSSSAGSLILSRGFWKDAYATGGNFEDGTLTVKGQLTLAEPQRNSLQQLSAYFDALYKIKRKKMGAVRAES